MAMATEGLVEAKVIRVGPAPHRHIGYADAVDRVWVSNSGGSTIDVLDGSSGEVVATIEVGKGPQHFVIDKDTLLGYIAIEGADTVAVVDARSDQVVAAIALPPGSAPAALLPAFARQRLWALNHGAGTISEIDLTSHTLVKTQPVGEGPLWGQPHSKSFGKAYVVNALSNDVAIIDEATGDVKARVAVGRRPERNATFRERRELYVANVDDHTVSAISIDTDEVVATVPVGIHPFRMVAMEEKTGRNEVWVLCRGSSRQPLGSISIVDGSRHVMVGSIAVVDRPANWLFEGDACYVSSGTQNVLAVINLRQRGVVATVPLRIRPETNAFSNKVFAKQGNLFLANSDDTVTLLKAG